MAAIFRSAGNSVNVERTFRGPGAMQDTEFGDHEDDDGTVRAAVRARRAELTRGEDRAATYLVSHYPSAGLGPMARFARAAGTSPQTVLRLLGKLGIDGWEALQERLRAELAAETASPLGRWSARRPAPDGDWLDTFAAGI